MSSPTGIGVIGLGHWGKHYARIFDWQLPDARLVRACDPAPDTLDAVHERHPGIALTASPGEVTSDPAVDAVVIATPASTHHAIAAAALRAGKHVLVEKPLCLSVEEACELRDLAAAAERTLLVGHTFVYNPAVRRMKELLDADDFGALYYLAARRTNLGPIRDDADALVDLAPHDVSIFDYLIGAEPVRATAVGGCWLREGRADAAFMTLEYPGGILATIQVSWVDAHKIREVVAIGSRRRVVFDDLDRLEPIRVVEKGIAVDRGAESFGEFQYQVRDGDIHAPRIEPREPLRVLCEHFLACVRDGARPISDAEQGIRVVRAIAALARSQALGGIPVEVATTEMTKSARLPAQGGTEPSSGRPRAIVARRSRLPGEPS